ncbi:MAG: iron ABC transporter permease [Myxococcota bacterium]
MSRQFLGTMTALGGLAAAICAVGMMVGRGDLGDEAVRATLLELRGSRVTVAFLAGAALAVAGVFVQGLFRNPLASPSILGTTAGATLGGQISLMLFEVFLAHSLAQVLAPELFLALGCVLGAGAALALLLVCAGRRADLVTLLLCGFILSSLFLSLGAFLLSIAQDSWELGRAVLAMALGGVGTSGMRHVALAVPLVAAGIAAAWLWRRPLDLMLSGQDEAQTLGVDTDAVRRWCVTWTAVLTAGAVAVGGNVGFVGLIVPHAMRRLVGVEHSRLIPAAAVAGGAFLVACDILTRLPGRDIPLGVITGLVGAPVFLTMLVRSRREGVLA